MLRELGRAALERYREQARGRGLQDADIIARRGAVIGSRYRVQEGVSRLMPIAAGHVRELDRMDKAPASGMVYWADTLHAPKGRMERSWWAPEGGIYLCTALVPELEQELWSLYGIAAGVSIAEVLREHGMDAEIRWINDILIGGRKVSGTIIETLRAPVSLEHWILVGTGINVNMDYFPPELESQASSLLLETGKRWDRDLLGAEIMARFGWNVGLLHHWDAMRHLEGEDFEAGESPVISSWRDLNSTIGKRIRFGADLEKWHGEEGRAVDITPDGRLVVETVHGERVVMESGEVRYE